MGEREKNPVESLSEFFEEFPLFPLDLEEKKEIINRLVLTPIHSLLVNSTFETSRVIFDLQRFLLRMDGSVVGLVEEPFE